MSGPSKTPPYYCHGSTGHSPGPGPSPGGDWCSDAWAKILKHLQGHIPIVIPAAYVALHMA